MDKRTRDQWVHDLTAAANQCFITEEELQKVVVCTSCGYIITDVIMSPSGFPLCKGCYTKEFGIEVRVCKSCGAAKAGVKLFKEYSVWLCKDCFIAHYNQDRGIAPPLGIVPFRIWVEARLIELSKVMYRYSTDKSILPNYLEDMEKWAKEVIVLIDALKKGE